MRARRLLALALAFTLIAGACGGDADPPDAGPDSDTGVSTDQPDSDDGGADDNGVDDDGDGSSDDSGSDDSTGEQEGGQAAAAGGPPDPSQFLPYAPAPQAIEPPAAAATGAEHVTAMFSTITDIVLGDRRAADANLFREMDRNAPEFAPDLVLAAISASASLSVEAFDAIEAYANAGVDAAYSPEFTEFFGARAAAAALYSDANQLIYDAVLSSRDLSYFGRACMARAIVDDGDSCSDDPAADALITQLIDESSALATPDLDEADDGFPRDADFCAAWDPVFAELGGLAQIFELLTEDSLVERRFLGREECRFVASLDGGPEDEIVWGPQQAVDAYTELYAQIAAAGINAPFDENVYDNDEYEVALPKQRETIIAQMTAGAGAVDLIGGVAEPRARLGLITIAYVASVERWWQETVLTLGLDGVEEPRLVLQETLAACVPDPFVIPPDTSGCTPEEIRTIELLQTTVQYTDYQTGTDEQGVVDWEDVQAAFPLCELWAAVLATIPADQAMRVDFQMSQLGTEELLGMDGCDSGISQPSLEAGDDG